MIVAEKDNTISLIRGFALCMILACHICQYFDLPLAWWLNVGVQVFLLISGFLYANKVVMDRWIFYRRRLCKILIEYWLFLLPTALLFCVFAPKIMRPIKIMDLFAAHGTVEGLGHLWFIPYIILCYVLTPLFQDIFNRIDEMRGYKYLIRLAFVLVMIQFLFTLYFPYFNPAWINAYILGMALGKLEKHHNVTRKRYVGLIVVITGALFMVHIGYKAGFGIKTEYLWKIIEPYWRDYEHVFLGASLFVCLRGMLSHMPGGGIARQNMLLYRRVFI